MSEQEQEHIESEQKAAFKQYFEALFDVADFASKYVRDGSEMDLLCEPHDILNLRKAFALTPEAVTHISALFENRLEFTARDFERWVRVCRSSIEEVEAENAEQDKDEEGGAV